MRSNTIIFADLSTYTLIESIAFYEGVFGWKYYENEGYHLAYKKNKAVAGLYETPEKFKQIRMPHFWMTYIEVDDVHSVVKKAKESGGIVELAYEERSIGEVALIRDPQGGGFTICERGELENVRTKNEADTLIWNELHVSDTRQVIPFYQNLFGWSFDQIASRYYQVRNLNSDYIADLVQIDNAYKGKYEYWVCTFAVSDFQDTKQRILINGGSIIHTEDKKILCADNSGQAFFYIQDLNGLI